MDMSRMTLGSVASDKPRKMPFRAYFKRNYDLYLLLVPGLIYAAVFKLLPLLGISIAFVDYNIFASTNPIKAILASDFVGFDHFIRVFQKRRRSICSLTIMCWSASPAPAR